MKVITNKNDNEIIFKFHVKSRNTLSLQLISTEDIMWEQININARHGVEQNLTDIDTDFLSHISTVQQGKY